MTQTHPNHKQTVLLVAHDNPNEWFGAVFALALPLLSDSVNLVLAVHQEGPIYKAATDLNLPVYKLHRQRFAQHPPLQQVDDRLSRWIRRKARGERLTRLIEDHQVDLIHSIGIHTVDGAYAATRCNKPHIWQINEILPGNRRIFGRFGTRKTLKSIRRYTSHILCVSNAVKRQFPGWQRSPDTFSTLYPGIKPFNHTDNSNSQAVSGLQKNPDVPLIGYIPPLRFEKGLQDLLQAARLLYRENVGFELVIAGFDWDTHYRRTLQATLASSGLQNHIRIIEAPTLNDLRPLFSDLDILIDPDMLDPYPVHTVEALMAGCPVIGCNSGGIPEIVQHQRNGLVYKSGQPDSLKKAITTLMRDPALCRQLANSGKARALEQFTTQRYRDDLTALYTRVAQKPSPVLALR